ncbi:prenyltransferase/squalene oxidase repeat-containing protein [Bdellovibrio sp. NC01]|uniref:prenyltransferase/squalene oxidase repeat-containing protein n=1 Tax=Bdellovibrio sp. NC01 TaxID=2220073 RepID=UPI001158ED55|nr:prenyltransferase/squalene oxidase repeat-containing protein [Bdellovibrio sp. NC01]QDK37004.1 hypothetical protein DOE51_05045 [Bdellovibrio sp. NC01]
MKAAWIGLGVGLWGLSCFAGPQFRTEVASALKFIERYQTTGDEGYDRGQWRAKVTSYVPSAIGVGKFNVPYDEPTAFVAGSIANVLSEIYFIDATFTSIPPMVTRTVQGFQKYYWGSLFNFYPSEYFNGVKIRQPRFMYLAPQWQGFANIPPDADTTSVANTTLHYYRSMVIGRQPTDVTAEVPEQVINALSAIRDLDRTPHIYNRLQRQIETGAFMTWLWDEKNPNMPHNYFARPDRGTRIPFNKNDVDCVVNANVLKLLSFARKDQGPGFKASCEHINRVVARKQFYFCGMYYPSRYALPYSVATNLREGVSCLEPSRQRLLNYVIAMQNPDGSWRNSFLARPDYIHSTAWALNALIMLGDPKNDLHRARIQRGVKFLLSQKEKDSAGLTYWPGQVFYAATFVARYPVVWRSTAYTTALSAKALLLADRFLNR